MKRFLSVRAAVAATACVSALAAAACASNAPRNDLSGSSWRVESIAGEPASGPTIEFTQDRVSGTGGCNRFFGGYTAASDRIEITNVGSTRMACEADIMRREADFFALLSGARAYDHSADQLILTGADGRALALRPA